MTTQNISDENGPEASNRCASQLALATPIASEYASTSQRQARTAEYRAKHLQICKLALRLRRSFVLISEFQQLCRVDAALDKQLFALEATLRNAQKLLPLAAALKGVPAALCEDERKCLRDLEDLQLALRDKVRPPQRELEHAMDALIILGIAIQSNSSQARQRRSGPANGLATPRLRKVDAWQNLYH